MLKSGSPLFSDQFYSWNNQWRHPPQSHGAQSYGNFYSGVTCCFWKKKKSREKHYKSKKKWGCFALPSLVPFLGMVTKIGEKKTNGYSHLLMLTNLLCVYPVNTVLIRMLYTTKTWRVRGDRKFRLCEYRRPGKVRDTLSTNTSPISKPPVSKASGMSTPFRCISNTYPCMTP